MSDYDFRVTANYNHTFDKAHIVNLFGGMETTEINRTKTFFEGWGMQFDAGETPFYVYDLFKRQIERSEVYYTLNNTHHLVRLSLLMQPTHIKENTLLMEHIAMKVQTKWDVVNKPVGCLLGTFRDLGTFTKKSGSTNLSHYLT